MVGRLYGGMTMSSKGSRRPHRSLVARLFARAIEGDARAERDLRVLAFDRADDRNVISDEARRALEVLGGPRSDGACPVELQRTERRAWATSYADQLRAELGQRDGATLWSRSGVDA